MSTQPSVLVIIVTWNKKSYVLDLLNSLRGLSYPAERCDILVVDNASSDGTVEELKRDFPHVRVIENSENLGGTGGFNTGLQHAFAQPEGKYDYLWLLDNDVQVHCNALSELVAILESEPGAAVAGSTMMQLTTPWRINEMGAFVDRDRGGLLLNRHRQVVDGLRSKTLEEMHGMDIDLSELLEHCRPSMDVEYVAAASLVVRADTAKAAGVWDDYFIHFDDVEWCLRIAGMGHRIMVSARSLIWHVPAEFKVPTWVLYYDNRNVLSLLDKHSGPASVRQTRRWIQKKAVYYTLLGKNDLAGLHLDAIVDFEQGNGGKKDIALDKCYFPTSSAEGLLLEEGVNRVLVPWTVDLQACDLQRFMIRAMKKKPGLRIDYLLPPPHISAIPRQLPGAPLVRLPAGRRKRLMAYLRLRNRYDLVLQSDYQPILPLNMVAPRILFANFENVSLRQRPAIKKIALVLKAICGI